MAFMGCKNIVRPPTASLLPPAAPLLVVVFLLLCACAPSGTDAWGMEGHQLICKIAENRLSKKAREAVSRVLERRRLEDLCSWPDMPEAKTRHPQSDSLHYVNIDAATCDFNQQRDCKDGKCVAMAIVQKESELRQRYGRESPDSKLNESLLFLAHFMGDIHQPLHVGFKSDLGGNAIKVTWTPAPKKKNKNLHCVWDTWIIRTALELYYGKSLDQMYHNIEQSIVARPIDIFGAHAYASESIRAACDYAYTNVTGEIIPRMGSQLTAEYASCRISLVKRRIAEAGFRLATMLNEIFG